MTDGSENFGRGNDEDNNSPQLENGSTNGEGGVNPRHLLETTLIDMIELGSGCTGDCVACGAFGEEYTPEERRVCTITPKQVEGNITQEIVDERTDTRHRLVDLFRRYMTSGVDMEPLESDIFNDSAETVDRLSDGKSRMVAVTHGLRCIEGESGSGRRVWKPVPAQLGRLERLAELMKQDKVPLLVLSIDPARERGLAGREAKEINEQLQELDKNDSKFMRIVRFQAQREQYDEGMHNPPQQESARDWENRLIRVKKMLLSSVQGKVQEGQELTPSEKIINHYLDLKRRLRIAVVEANAQSYAATVCALRPAIEAKKRVAFSLQGDSAEDSPVYVGITYEIFQRMYEILQREHGIEGTELYQLVEKIDVQPPRFYTGAGRAKSLLEIVEDRACTVIPYRPFVEGPFRADPFRINRGRIRPDGTLEIQIYRPKWTYNDTVDPRDNPWRVVDLRRQIFETVEVAEPQNCMERLQFNAEPRFVEIPEASGEKGNFMRTVYPLSCVDKEHREQVFEGIAHYIQKFTDISDLSSISDEDLRRYAIEALIPGEDIDDFPGAAESFAERIIRMHTPVLGEDSKDQALEMGKILALKALFNEWGIKIKLVDDKDSD